MALNGGAFDDLLSYWEVTGPRYMKPLKTFLNDATLHTYTTRRIQTGRNLKEIVRHGSTLKERVFLTAAKKFKRVGIDPEYTFEYKDVGVDIEVKWSIALNDITLNELALDLNADMFRPEALAHIFKSYSEQQWMQLWTDTENSLEDEWWAVPDASKMEVSGGNAEAPYSLNVFANEFPNGLPQATDQPGGTWSTIQTLNPTSSRAGGNWDCQRVGYTYDGSPDGETRSIFTSMSKLWHYCKFDPFPNKPEYSDKMSTPHFIGTQLDGVLNFEHSLRINQDYFRGKASGQDPAYPGPTFMGIPIVWIEKMDTMEVYPTGAGDTLGPYNSTANAAAGAITSVFSGGVNQLVRYAGPRYKFTNGTVLKCIWHANHFMKLRGMKDVPNRPFSKAQLVSFMNNNMCFSRRRQGELVPTANVLNYDAA